MKDPLRQFKANIFQALAHPTRIAILEFLGEGELSAGVLIEKLGMEQANVSQHLAILRAKQIVANRKAGNQVFYSVRDPIIVEVLHLMRTYFQSLAIILLWPRMIKRVPGSIVALLLSTVAVAVFRLPIETIGSKFGGIPQGFPHFAIPHVQAGHILPLLPAAFSVALLAAVESLLSAVVADGMSGDHHNSNVELVAQGFANIVSPLFGGMPATGAIARTAQISGIVEA